MPEDKLQWVKLDTKDPIWENFFTVAPLVVIGTREGHRFDLAPKHMAMPLGHDNYFGFICTPRHSTYHNVQREAGFTVSFPKPGQIVLTSLSASPREGTGDPGKPVVQKLPTVEAPGMDGIFLRDSYLFLECEHEKTLDGFGQNSLICGRITGAYLDPAYQRLSEVDEQEMVARSPLLAYLAYGRFAEIRNSMAFPFPKDFKN